MVKMDNLTNKISWTIFFVVATFVLVYYSLTSMLYAKVIACLCLVVMFIMLYKMNKLKSPTQQPSRP